MEVRLLGDDVDSVGGHHVEGSVGDVYDAGYTKDKGKPNGDGGAYAPTDETDHDDVYDESYITSVARRIWKRPVPSL
jgi:hypothetical protein